MSLSDQAGTAFLVFLISSQRHQFPTREGSRVFCVPKVHVLCAFLHDLCPLYCMFERG